MKKITIILFLLLSTILFAQTTYVPDDNFEQALIDLGYDDVLDDYVLTGNINGVFFLDVSSKNINDLTGIEDFTSLMIFNCSVNPLTQLDISQNLSLTQLLCDICQLTQLDVSQNLALEHLWCYENQLTNLDVTQNTSLHHLYCSDNQLTQLDISQNITLYRLYCNENQLTQLDVSQNSSLTRLYCNENQLTQLDVSQNLALEHLWCDNNLLTQLDVSNNLSLHQLYCTDNQLLQLDVSLNTSLFHLICYNNELTQLDVSQNTSLYFLYCNGNQLTQLDVSQNILLRILYCYENQLTQLDVKNGNNINMDRMIASDNPNLTCIQVDDENATYPICDITNYTGWCKDEWAEYSENCPPIGLEENLINVGIRLYPNPTQNILNIETTNLTDKKYTIYNIYGCISKQGVIDNNQIDISTLNTGIYLLKLGDVTYKTVKL